MEALPFWGGGTARAPAQVQQGRESLSNRSVRSRSAWLLAGCSSLFALTLPAPAVAQDQPPPTTQAQTDARKDVTPGPGDTEAAKKEQAGAIVVTGIRGGIRSSINIKRRETSIVEAVSAEEIGKLPDISIAESIARLPGLAAQRVNGRAQVISIRGLSPDFTTTLLNGRQQASSGDNRAVEFDQYPSELLSSVVIYKTPDANIAGFGLSGTADLRTVRPLAFGKRVVSVNLRGEVNQTDSRNRDVSNKGWRASASYIDQISPQLGIALGVAYLDSPSSKRHTHTWWYESYAGTTGIVDPAGAEDALFLGGDEAFSSSMKNKRLAGIGILEWQPSDQVHTVLDLYYSRFRQRETMRGAQWWSTAWLDNHTFSNVQTGDLNGSKTAISGTMSNFAPIIRNDYNTRDDELFSAGLNNEFTMTDKLSLITDLSYSSNKRDESITETYAYYGKCCFTPADGAANRIFGTLNWQLANGNGFDQFTPSLNYADVNQVTLGDRDPWGWGHDGLTKRPHVKEDVYSADGGLRYRPTGSPIEQIDIGANYTRRDKRKTVDEFDMMLKNGRLETLVGPEALVAPTSLDFAGFGPVLSYDVPTAMQLYYDYVPTEDSAHYDKSWAIKEDVLTLKARGQFAFGELHGNIGIQAVYQKQSSTGQRINFLDSPPVITNEVRGDNYWDILPSLNAYYDFGNGHRLRFAAAKVMARPRMDELRANLIPGFNSGICQQGCPSNEPAHPWSANGGNPNLRPWRATALDVSYEWYIGPASYIAIAGFYKHLDNYIYNRVRPFDFSSFPLPSTAHIITDAGYTISPIGTINMPDNGPGGDLYGAEFSGALELSRLSPILDGFGVLGSLSITRSKLNPTDNSGEEIRIPGLSGTVANLTGYFEKRGFQARVSYRYRSPFKGEVVQLFANRGFTEILADRQVDAQVGYTFQEGSRFKNLGVLLQVYNLTDSPYRTRHGLDKNELTPNGGVVLDFYEKYGRTWLLGMNYKF